jgi:hypothetical protein
MEKVGHKQWVISGGHIPLKGTGREPWFLSQDRIAILNPNKNAVSIRLKVLFAEQEAIDSYQLEINGERLLKFRVNDLINPFPVPLEEDYALIVEASEPVVVQFLRMNSGQRNLAIMGTMAFGTEL